MYLGVHALCLNDALIVVILKYIWRATFYQVGYWHSNSLGYHLALLSPPGFTESQLEKKEATNRHSGAETQFYEFR